MHGTIPPAPWYRQLWPWLLMLMPGLALVGGAVTFWLALSTNNALVVDDYYREGRAINQQLARDRAAGQLGLAGELRRDGEGGAHLTLSVASHAALPPFVTLRLVHATRAELDRVVSLAAAGAGVYVATGARLPDSGRWNVMVEDPERRWRLVATSSGFGAPVVFGTAH